MALTQRVGLASLLSVLALACSADPEGPGPTNPSGGSNGSGSPGGAHSSAGSNSTGATPSTGGSAPSNGGGTAQTGGTDSNTGGTGAVGQDPDGTPGPRLRILTKPEFKNSLNYLLGTINAPLELPADLDEVGGLAAVGAGIGTINATSVALYEAAVRQATAEVFADNARWQKLVGCQPKVDLSDACVTTFIQTFGKRAFRRDLTAEEVQQWLTVGKGAAQLANSAAQGLSTLTSGILQSPFFLYRIETTVLDAGSKRLKYNGPSMAIRLAYLLTGAPPSDALLAAAASGQLDTADGVKTAAGPLLSDARVLDRMAVFFNEFAQSSLVQITNKDEKMFPEFTPAMRNSMQQSVELFLRNVVLAPGTDVRRLFDSDQFFVDATLAPLYGVTAPASGFMQIKLGPESGRAGLLGQAAVLAGHSQPQTTSPTRRGIFITDHFLCIKAPDAPNDGTEIPPLPTDPNLTARQKLDVHRVDPKCATCHSIFDPFGFGLEKLDPIGRYRTMEAGQPIDATGALAGVPYDGAVEMGAVFAKNETVINCVIKNFYRHANGVQDDSPDSAQITALSQALASKGYVWRDFVGDFIASDAFRSAPAVATAGSL